MMKHLFAGLSCLVVLVAHAFAGGPTGYGPIKLGMTKSAIEALQPADGVHLSSPMTPFVYHPKSPPAKAGEEKFDATVLTPLSSAPMKSVFTFSGGALTGILLVFDEKTHEQVRSQLQDRYGAGSTEDRRKEEQCIYRNGSNFKLSSGPIDITWTESLTDGAKAETKLVSILVDFCPSSLRDRRISTKLFHLSIQLRPAGEPVDPSRPRNLF